MQSSILLVLYALLVTVVLGGNHPTEVDGGWSDWSPFGECSKIYGKGWQYRTRSCDNPSPSCYGKQCEGSPIEGRECNYPVDGGWSEWSSYGECSKIYGKGWQSKYRSCDNPSPSYYGKPCEGSPIEGSDCNLPANGVFMSPNFPEDYPENANITKTIEVEADKVIQIHFTDFHLENETSCSYDYLIITEKDGSSVLPKSCGDIVPEDVISTTNRVNITFISDGSDIFSGFNLTWSAVSPTPCKWSEWSPYEECSKTCGKGWQNRYRWCHCSSHGCGVKTCEGSATEEIYCNDIPCPTTTNSTTTSAATTGTPTCAPQRPDVTATWCKDNCFHNPPYCPASHCICSEGGK